MPSTFALCSDNTETVDLETPRPKCKAKPFQIRKFVNLIFGSSPLTESGMSYEIRSKRGSALRVWWFLWYFEELPFGLWPNSASFVPQPVWPQCVSNMLLGYVRHFLACISSLRVRNEYLNCFSNDWTQAKCEKIAYWFLGLSKVSSWRHLLNS